MKTVTFPVVDLRTVKDPTLGEGVKRSSFYLRVVDVPDGLPKWVNPRSSKPNGKTYKEVRESLVGESEDTQGLFHLRNQGITILAESLYYDPATHICRLDFDPAAEENKTQGIVNGGHTYDIIRSVLTEALEDNSEIPKEFVRVDILTGINNAQVGEIAKGLNTSVQVTPQAIANLEGDFNWIKDTLKEYLNKISWEQNDTKDVEVADVLKYIHCMDFKSFPDDSTHPTFAYNLKKKVVSLYLTDPEKYKKFTPVLLDLCKLHDHIALGAMKLWNAHETKNGHGKYAKLTMSKLRRPGKGKTIFADALYPMSESANKNTHLLEESIVLPILSAFRVYLQEDVDGVIAWKTSFDHIIKVWEEVGYSFLEKAWYLVDKGHLAEVGKTSTFWEYAYMKLQYKEATER